MPLLLALTLLVQAKDPLAENWKQLQEAWKAGAQAAGDEDYVADRFLEAAAGVFAAFKACGLNEKTLPADRAALKRAVKARLAPAVRAKLPVPKDAKPERQDEMRKLIEEVTKSLEETYGKKNTESFSDVVTRLAASARSGKESDVVGALEALVVVEKDAPPWLKRRVACLVIAIETGGDYPAVAAATPELKTKIAKLIELLGDTEMAERDRAYEELLEIGEPALQQLEEAARSSDAEVRVRARKILGLKD